MSIGCPHSLDMLAAWDEGDDGRIRVFCHGCRRLHKLHGTFIRAQQQRGANQVNPRHTRENKPVLSVVRAEDDAQDVRQDLADVNEAVVSIHAAMMKQKGSRNPATLPPSVA